MFFAILLLLCFHLFENVNKKISFKVKHCIPRINHPSMTTKRERLNMMQDDFTTNMEEKIVEREASGSCGVSRGFLSLLFENVVNEELLGILEHNEQKVLRFEDTLVVLVHK